MPVALPFNTMKLDEFDELVFAEFSSNSMDEIWDFVYTNETPIFVEFVSKNLAFNYRQKLYSRRSEIHKTIYKGLNIYEPIAIQHREHRLFLLWAIPQKNIRTHKKQMFDEFNKKLELTQAQVPQTSTELV